jgi:integrase
MAKKRSNGEGMLRQRKDGSWEARVTIGRDPGTGKLIRRSYYAKTQAEVRRKLTASTHNLDEGVYTEPSKLTTGQWLDIWHKEYLGGVKPHTVSQYGTQIKVHIKPSLGSVRLQALTAPMIQSMYNTKLKEISTKSIRNLHGVLHKALSQAVKLGYIRFNPSDACELPRVVDKQIKPIEGEYVGIFLNTIKGHRYETLYLVTLFTGIRQGEALGLTWDEVDFTNGTINISKQLQKERIDGGGGKYHFVSLKNDKSRTISLAPFVLDNLRLYQIKQQDEKIQAGSAWDNHHNLVFTDELGHHLYTQTVLKNFKQIVEGIGIPETRFHDLRYTYATISLQNGDDIKSVSEALGHATVAFTMDVYGHVTQKMKKDSVNRMQDFYNSL